MNLLIATDNFGKGGIQRQIVELLRGLKEDPSIHAELLVMGRNMDYPEVFELAGKVHILDRKTKWDSGLFRRVYQFLKNHQPDIVHSFGNMASIYLAPSVKILGIPFINGLIRDAPIWKHPFHPYRMRARMTYPFSDLVLGNSQAGLDSYGAPRSKGMVVVNGINLERSENLLPEKEVRERFGVKTEKVAGMVGGFNYRKDFATLVKAAMLVLEKDPEVTFLAIGDGPTLEPLKASVPETYSDRILFPGKQSDVESIINIFTVGVLATNSREHGEGISNSIMEYMLLGKPVVATAGGGTPEIVVDEETGYIIPPYQPGIMAEKILYLLDHPKMAEEMGRLGRKRIEDHFALDKLVLNCKNIYEKYRPTLKARLRETAGYTREAD